MSKQRGYEDQRGQPSYPARVARAAKRNKIEQRVLKLLKAQDFERYLELRVAAIMSIAEEM